MNASNYPPFPIKQPNWLQAYPGRVPELCLTGISELKPARFAKNNKVLDDVANTETLELTNLYVCLAAIKLAN